MNEGFPLRLVTFTAFKIEHGRKVVIEVSVDPTEIKLIERAKEMTMVLAAGKEYFTRAKPEIILKSMSEAHKYNTRLIKYS